MKYLINITSFEDLKKQYKKKAMQLHPDMGGTLEAMQELNSEYEILFPIWKRKNNITSEETAYESQSEFYTSNGWKGSNYNISRSNKDIANIIRTYIKEVYSEYKFSVVSGSYSIGISLLEAPYNVFTYGEEHSYISVNHYHIENETRLVPEAVKVLKDIINVANSYRWDDSDGMIDYFDTNFYLDVSIGKWNKPFEVVKRKPKTNNYEYETYTEKVKKTRRVIVAVPMEHNPTTLEQGMHFMTKSYFSGQIRSNEVYVIDTITDKYVLAYWTGKKKTNICKGNTPGNRFYTAISTFWKFVSNHSIEFVELKEDKEEYEVEVTKKRRVSKNKPDTINK